MKHYNDWYLDMSVIYIYVRNLQKLMMDDNTNNFAHSAHCKIQLIKELLNYCKIYLFH